MVTKVHGAMSATQGLNPNLEYYTMYCSAPNAVSDPPNTTGIDILVTGDLTDDSQRNFEVLVQSVGLRAMPVIMNNPAATDDLDLMGAPTLTGEGFIWKFAVELRGVFHNHKPTGTQGEVGLLVDELHGIVLPSGVVIDTKTGGKNIEIIKNVGL